MFIFQALWTHCLSGNRRDKLCGILLVTVHRRSLKSRTKIASWLLSFVFGGAWLIFNSFLSVSYIVWKVRRISYLFFWPNFRSTIGAFIYNHVWPQQKNLDDILACMPNEKEYRLFSISQIKAAVCFYSYAILWQRTAHDQSFSKWAIRKRYTWFRDCLSQTENNILNKAYTKISLFLLLGIAWSTSDLRCGTKQKINQEVQDRVIWFTTDNTIYLKTKKWGRMLSRPKERYSEKVPKS